MGAVHHQLGNLTALVDINALQADGPTAGVLSIEPIHDKWTAFGWHVQRVDGNDVDAVVAALDAADAAAAPPGSRPSSSATPRSAAGCRCWRTGRRRTSCASTSTNGRSAASSWLSAHRKDRTDDHHHRRRREAEDVGHDRLVRRPRPEDHRRPRSGTPWSRPRKPTTGSSGCRADLAKYTDMHIFAQAFPERFFQLGMAEQLLLGAAAGFAEAGLIPFASTYSVFATRRAYDFLCLDAAEPGLNVNVVGGLPGLTTGYGPSHQATEDVAIFRGIPGLTIVDPCDSVDIEQAVPQLAATPGPTYLRLLRGKVPTVLDEYDYTFELGKAKILRPGRDVVLVSSGLMTMRALQAAERLAAHHVDVSVVHSPTLKPFDADTVLAEIDTDRLALTCENHTVIGGLFETTAAAAARAGLGRGSNRRPARPVPRRRRPPTLHDRYGLRRPIVERVRSGSLLTLLVTASGAAYLSTDSCRRRPAGTGDPL